MRRAACLLIFLTFMCTAVNAQRPADDGLRQPRILLILDASSSMLQPWNTTIRFKAAGRIVAALMDSIYAVNAGVEFGLRVYGHQSPSQNNDCFDSKQEVMFSKNNLTQMSLRLASLKPFGVSPIAYSLKEAAENDLVDEVRNAYSVILITDGGESCGGNICDVVRTLIEHKIYFRPYILSLVDYAPLKDQYACLGTYLQVAGEKEIATAIHKIVDAYRPLLSMPIMAVKTEPVAPKPNVTLVTIPAWIPDRSSVASLSIPVTRIDGMPVYHTSPAPRAVQVPRPATVSAPPPEPVISRDIVTVAALSSIPGSHELQVRYASPVIRRIRVPRPESVTRPLPEPVVPRDVITIASLNGISGNKELRTYHTSPVPRSIRVPNPASVSKPPPEPVVAVPAIPKRDTIAAINSAARLKKLLVYYTDPVPDRMPVPRYAAVTKPPAEPTAKQPVVIRDLVVTVKQDALAARPTMSSRSTHDTTKSAIVIKRMDMPLPPAVKRNPGTALPAGNKPKEMEFTSQSEDAKETSLAILFTDGHGKFYASTPQLQLMDAASGKLVKQFYRTVDAAGNPDPLTISAGTYNLLVVGRANMLMRHIVVEKNKKNRIIVKVSNGSLRFRYEDAPDRPVEEFEAIVNIRFEPGPTVKQRCTAELEYPPGNYYIEINTLPVSRFNTDIDFGAITEIQIPQSGYVQFTNTTAVGTISLYTPLGDKFVRFHGLRITGNPADQRLRLKPGTYEVHWVKNPSAPFATETIERFVVKSNSVTEMELR